jgi:Mg-chelatase subunit ChlD
MKRLSLGISVALLTFVFGITISARYLSHTPAIAGPSAPPTADAGQQQTLEMVFVIDTTGSMGGLLEGAKQKIWGIVNEVMQSPARPSVKIGLVAYRDRGDAYVTQVLPLTVDLDKVYTTLMDYRAEGGGDTPEDVRRALADGVHQAGWSKPSRHVAQVIFLVGDAPPHDDYVDAPDVLKTVAQAVGQNMIVNTIQCGNMGETARAWQMIARRGEGQYFAIAQNGGVEAVASPYDARLSELGAKLGRTYTAYGGGPAGATFRAEAVAEAAAVETKITSNADASMTAERAVNKALNRDAYVGDLLQNLENGSLKIESVKKDDLPDDLQKLSAEERKREIEKRLESRRKLRAEIVSLSKQRDEFIAAERKKKPGAEGGFDAAVSAALKAQVARKLNK